MRGIHRGPIRNLAKHSAGSKSKLGTVRAVPGDRVVGQTDPAWAGRTRIGPDDLLSTTTSLVLRFFVLDPPQFRLQLRQHWQTPLEVFRQGLHQAGLPLAG
jgi:hypothetical protein